jgi:hypothetical protein
MELFATDQIDFLSVLDWDRIAHEVPEIIKKKYHLHTIKLHFYTNSEMLAQAIDELLYYFNQPNNEPISKTVNFILFDWPDTQPLPVNAKEIVKKENLRYRERVDPSIPKEVNCFQYNDTFWIDYFNEGFIGWDNNGYQVFGCIKHSTFNFLPVVNCVIQPVLAEILKKQGWYPIHACAVARNGYALLFPAKSQGGKTTTTLYLLSQGFQFLSDDMPLLSCNTENRYEVLCFPGMFRIRPPSWELLTNSLSRPEANRIFYNAEEFFPQSIVNKALLRAIIFPEIKSQSEVILERLNNPTAIHTLLAHSFLSTDANMAKEQFQLLTKLIESTECYRLYITSDLSRILTPLNQLLNERK